MSSPQRNEIHPALYNFFFLAASHNFKPVLGKSKGGLTKGGLSPRFSEKIGGKSFLRNRALFRANRDLFRAYRGLFGADRDQFLRTPQPRGKSRNCPERALFGPIGPFWAKPPFAKPPFGFSQTVIYLKSQQNLCVNSRHLSCETAADFTQLQLILADV